MREPIGFARNRVNVVFPIWRSKVNAMTGEPLFFLRSPTL